MALLMMKKQDDKPTTVASLCFQEAKQEDAWRCSTADYYVSMFWEEKRVLVLRTP